MLTELSNTYRCTDCDTVPFPVGTSKGDALMCNCASDDPETGDVVFTKIVHRIDHEEFPDSWEFDEQALEDKMDPVGAGDFAWIGDDPGDIYGRECPECGVEIDAGSLRWNGQAWEHKNPNVHPQAGHHMLLADSLQ